MLGRDSEASTTSSLTGKTRATAGWLSPFRGSSLSASLPIGPLAGPSRCGGEGLSFGQSVTSFHEVGRTLRHVVERHAAPAVVRVQLCAHVPIPGTREPRAVSGACGIGARAPWSTRFPPPSPPTGGRLCSKGSLVLSRGLTPRSRARRPYGVSPSPPGLVAVGVQTSPRSPGSRAGSFSTCLGS